MVHKGWVENLSILTNLIQIYKNNRILRRFQIVRTDQPGHSCRKENFTLNQNYPARSVRSWTLSTKKMDFQQKPFGKRLLHSGQNDWSSQGLASQFWLLESALSMVSVIYHWVNCKFLYHNVFIVFQFYPWLKYHYYTLPHPRPKKDNMNKIKHYIIIQQHLPAAAYNYFARQWFMMG